MNELPLQFKKEIIKFCKEYEDLAKPKKVKITINIRKEIVVPIVWMSDNYVELNNDRFEYFDVCDNVHNSKEILEINKQIKLFIRKTEKFGRDNFNDKEWLWLNVLWSYRPEHEEKFKPSSVKWVKDYNSNE